MLSRNYGPGIPLLKEISQPHSSTFLLLHSLPQSLEGGSDGSSGRGRGSVSSRRLRPRLLGRGHGRFPSLDARIQSLQDAVPL